MARLPRGIMGGISGKLGPLAGTSWKGINVASSLPVSTNHQPTPTQLIQREKFKTVSNFLNPLKQLLNESFNAQGKQQTGYNIAMSYHLREALLEQDNGFAINYAKSLVAMGPLRAIEAASLDLPSPGQLQLQWDNNSNKAMAQPTDLLLVVLYNVQTHTCIWQLTGTTRARQQHCMSLPEVAEAQVWHVWAAFMDTTTKITSLSEYFGEVGV